MLKKWKEEHQELMASLGYIKVCFKKTKKRKKLKRNNDNVCMYKFMYRKAIVPSASHYSLKNLHLKLRITKMIK